MNNLERLFDEEKRKLDELIIPEEFESLLIEKLEKKSRKKFKSIYKKIAVFILFILLFGYNLDTLAYYGKKLVGYDQIMTGTLQELNDLGKGQEIEESYTFSDGVSVNLDGVMLDDNSLILYYTIEDPTEKIDSTSERIHVDVTGIFERGFSTSGIGESQGERYLRFALQTHETLKFYENTLKLRLFYTTEDGDKEYGEISFKLDRNKAVGKSMEIPITKKIKIDKRDIKVKSLTASPTATIVKGQIQNTLELGLDYFRKDRIYPENVEMQLYCDGVEIPRQGAGMSTNLNGINFDITFDKIPESTKMIQLKLLSFQGEFDVGEKIDLRKGVKKHIKIEGQDLYIDRVYEEGDNTFIDITTEENVTLPGISLVIGETSQELMETIQGNSIKKVDNGKNKIYNSRTLKFPGTGEQLKLHIQRIQYTKLYDQMIFSYQMK